MKWLSEGKCVCLSVCMCTCRSTEWVIVEEAVRGVVPAAAPPWPVVSSGEVLSMLLKVGCRGLTHTHTD